MISDMIATCESMRINFDALATEGLFDKFLPKTTVYDSPNKAFEVLMTIAHKNNYEFEKDDAAKKRKNQKDHGRAGQHIFKRTHFCPPLVAGRATLRKAQYGQQHIN